MTEESQALSVILFGTPELHVDGQPLAKVRRKNRALVYYLAAHARALTRDHLLAFFWPDYDRPAAQPILRTMLHDLRKALGDQIAIEDETVGLAAGAFVDARAFAAVLESPHGQPADAAAPDLLAALDRYRGPFLEGFTLADSPEFDDWAALERERYRQLALHGFARAARLFEDLRDYHAALRALDRGLSLDRLQEDLQRDAMRLQYLNGDRAGAIRRFEALCKWLDDEMGVPPMPETRAVYDAIITDALITAPPGNPGVLSRRSGVDRAASRSEAERSGVDQGLVGAPSAPGSGLVGPSAPLSLRTPEGAPLPYAGRTAELAALAGLAGSGKLILITGEAGIGKTRLAEEFMAELAQPGPQAHKAPAVLRGMAHELEQGLPYQPIIDALRSLSSRPEWPDWRRDLDLDPLWLAEIIRLAPELQASFPGVHAAAQPADEGRLWESLLRFLHALARRRTVCLFLDDLHWADEATIGWLGYAVRGQRPASTLILLAASRPVEDRSRLATLVRALLHHDQLAQLPLAALSPAEVGRVAEHLSAVQGRALAAWLNEYAEGNPYFLTELVRLARHNGTLSSDGRLDPELLAGKFALPPTIQNLIHSRLLRLPEDARQLLRIAAVVGQESSFDLLRQVVLPRQGALPQQGASISEEQALEALEHLQAAGLLLPRGGDLLAFDHHLTLQVVVQDMGELRVRHLHRRVAEALEQVHGDQPAAAGLIARHFFEGQVPERAGPYAHQAGRHAASLAAWAEAIAHYESALAAEPGPEQQATIYLDRGYAHFHKGDFPSATQDLYEAVRLAQACGSQSLLEAAHLALNLSLIPQSRYAEAIALAQELKAAGPPELAACAEFMWGNGLTLDSTHPVEAERHLREAERLLERPSGFSSAISRAELKYTLAGALGQQGRFAEAIDLYRTALQLAGSDERQLDLLRRIMLHNNLAYYLHLVGDPQASRQIQVAIELARDRGSLSHLPYLYSTAGEIALGEDHLDTAEGYFVQGLDLARQVPVPERMAGITAHLGRVAQRRGQDDLARQLLNDALAAANDLNATHLAVRIHIWLAPLLSPDDARRCLEDARYAAKQGGYAGLLADIASLEKALLQA